MTDDLKYRMEFLKYHCTKFFVHKPFSKDQKKKRNQAHFDYRVTHSLVSSADIVVDAEQKVKFSFFFSAMPVFFNRFRRLHTRLTQLDATTPSLPPVERRNLCSHFPPPAPPPPKKTWRWAKVDRIRLRIFVHETIKRSPFAWDGGKTEKIRGRGIFFEGG